MKKWLCYTKKAHIPEGQVWHSTFQIVHFWGNFMKSKLLLSLLTLALLPAQLSATVVCAEIWQRPNGTRVVILENDVITHHTEISTQIEKQQAIDCVTHFAQNKNNLHVFMPKFYQEQMTSMCLDIEDAPSSFKNRSRLVDDVHYGLCENRLPYTPLSFFTDKSLNKNAINLKLFAQTLLDQSQKAIIPNALKSDYMQHQKAVAKYLKSLPSALSYRSLAKWLDRSEKNQSLSDRLMYHAVRLFNISLAAQIANASVAQKDIFIVSEEVCIKMMQRPLSALGYTHIATLGEPYLIQLNAAYEQCPKGFLDTTNDELNAIENEVTNRCALNLNELFKK